MSFHAWTSGTYATDWNLEVCNIAENNFSKFKTVGMFVQEQKMACYSITWTGAGEQCT